MTKPQLRRLRSLSVLAIALAASCLWVSAATAADQGAAQGPDVTVYSLPSVSNYGSVGTIHAFAVGTTSCNQGNEPLNWCDENSGCAPGAENTDHPVIGQNVYRLKDGRFEQIGMSWLKHGFLALAISAPECGDGSCDSPPFGSNQLGVGCTDPYGSGLNGSRPLGKRSDTNAATGEHPTRPNSGGSGNIAERIQIEEADLDPDLNVGAMYWVEGHYIAPDDATESNGLNNASYRPATFSQSLNMSLTGSTAREQAAIYAWQAEDPEVELIHVDVEGSRPLERFHAARRVTGQETAEGLWHYEYVIHNLNSDRSARSFHIQFPAATLFTEVGFRDIDHHSGEPYATTDWDITIDGPAGTVEWSTDTFAADEDANALRWGTMFSFWFDTDVSPTGMVHTLGLFKPGLPTAMDMAFEDMFAIFSDGFEGGGTTGWSEVVEN